MESALHHYSSIHLLVGVEKTREDKFIALFWSSVGASNAGLVLRENRSRTVQLQKRLTTVSVQKEA